MAGGSIVNTWVSGASHSSAILTDASFPSIQPIDVAVANSAGNWLFAIITWDQSAVLTGIQFATSTSVCDDAHNFWLPVTVVQPNTGVLRSAVWMAPAARPASFVFASQTGFQQANTVTIIEVQATVPWYSVTAIANTFTNAGTSITLSQTAPTGQFSVGAIAYDNNTASVSFTSTGWVNWNTNSTTNSVDHTADITTTTFVATTTGSALTLSASSATSMNWSEVIIAVQGVSNTLPVPFTEVIQNWPDIIVEATCGQVLNQNFSFVSNSTSPWAGHGSATLSIAQIYTFGNLTNSLVITPNGVTVNPGAFTEQVLGAQPYTQYTSNVWLTSPLGTAFNVQIGLQFFDSGGSFISSSFGPSNIAATGSLQQLTWSAYSPANTARVQLGVQMLGTPASTVLTYIGYAAVAIPGAYGDIPQDQLQWIDLSARAITQDSIKISRGIQYENQSLEAGTLELTLADSDGVLTPGNQQSIYYPYIGDTDVNVRVRVIWPYSLTPYAVAHRGFTDDVQIQYEPATKYQYLDLTSSDVWSRMTAQMITATQQEYLSDNPYGVWPCYDPAGSLYAHNILTTGQAGPLAVAISGAGIGSGVTQAFGSSALSTLLQGDSGGTGWSVAGLGSATSANGASLTFFPENPRTLPALSTGITVQFWVSMGAGGTINWNPRILCCVSAVQRLFEIVIISPGAGGTAGNIVMSVYDKATGAATSTTISTGSQYSTNFFVTARVTTTTWSTYIIQATATGAAGSIFTSGSCNLTSTFDGFIFNGLNTPVGTFGTGVCYNGTMQDVVIYPFLLPPARVAAHFFMSFVASYGEAQNFGSGAAAGPSFGDTDLERMGIIASYSGFTAIPLAMRGVSVPSVNNTQLTRPPGTGTDWVTAATDTNGQIASDYMTNIAASTVAAMFVDGPGALVYRRREEWYGLAPKWTMGEAVPVPLTVNPFFDNNVASWTAVNATFTFGLYSGQFGTNGGVLTANGAGVVTLTSEDEPATQGQTYSAFGSVNAPAGYTAGAFLQISWLNSGHSVISSVTSNTYSLPAGQWTYLVLGGSQAPAGTAFVRTILSTSGTPSSNTVFDVDAVYPSVSPGEAPYLVSVHFAQDRAQLFNSAIITQFGTQVQTLFTGPGINFQPTSGVTVTAENATSVANRGNVPYVSTCYLANTLQNPAQFLPNTGSVEDFASWIINTLATPSLRTQQCEITPAATFADSAMGFLGELGDTVILNRRSLGSPQFSMVTYISHIEHTIDIKSGQWNTSIELSPNSNLQILITDHPAYGVLDGINRLGW